MTHGRMWVGDLGQVSGITLYAWHDGHAPEALADVARLPLTLFEFAKRACEGLVLRGDKTFHGPWYYHHYLGYALEPPSRWREGPRWTSYRYFQREWRSSIPLEVASPAVANWITWVRFNRWTAVPSVDWCPYPGEYPDVRVSVNGAGYHAVPERHMPREQVEECRGPWEKAVAEVASAVGEDLITPALGGVGGFVPFEEITCRLLWAEIHRAWHSPGPDEDPLFAALRRRHKEDRDS